MNYRVELGLTLLVSAVGASYFGWRTLQTEGNGRLTYGALVIGGIVVAYYAIKDILGKQRQVERNGDVSERSADPREEE